MNVLFKKKAIYRVNPKLHELWDITSYPMKDFINRYFKAKPLLKNIYLTICKIALR
jgi:hypothetical protein